MRALKKNVEHKAWFLFSTLVLDKLKMLGINLISLKIILINKIFSKTKKNRFLQILYLTHRSFRDSVFARRDNLFFDYLKITFLFSKGLVNLEVFLFFLAEIFKFLPKHKHVRFMNLLKTFAILVNSSSLKETNSLGVLDLQRLITKRLVTPVRVKLLFKWVNYPSNLFQKMWNLQKLMFLQDTEFLVLNYGLFENKNLCYIFLVSLNIKTVKKENLFVV